MNRAFRSGNKDQTESIDYTDACGILFVKSKLSNNLELFVINEIDEGTRNEANQRVIWREHN